MFRQVVELMNANPLSFGALILAVGIGGNTLYISRIISSSSPSDDDNDNDSETTTTTNYSTFLQKSNTYVLMTGVVIFLVGLAVHFYDASYGRHRRQRRAEDNSDSRQNSKAPSSTSSSTTSKSTSASTRLRNVWDMSRKAGSNNETNNKKKEPSSSSSSSSDGEKKQFYSSKYYYAHNNPNATGGYKDGLKMEDYQMNGPRLLSKGGKPVVVDDNGNENDNANASGLEGGNKDDSEEDPTMMTNTDTARASSILRESNTTIPINKYLWDDPGDSTTGIATIRIEVLPDPTTKVVGQFIDCKDMTLEDGTVSLAGEGLVFNISATPKNTNSGNSSDSPSHKYQLKIPKLYGDAADVKLVLKPKRILIKIYKKKNSFLSSMSSSRKNNLDPWPQPHRKI